MVISDESLGTNFMVRFFYFGFACSSLDVQNSCEIMSNDALAPIYAVADRTDLSPLPHRPLKSSVSHLHSPADMRLTLRYRIPRSATAIMRVGRQVKVKFVALLWSYVVWSLQMPKKS